MLPGYSDPYGKRWIDLHTFLVVGTIIKICHFDTLRSVDNRNK